jgi:hypothetical protein
MFGAEIDDCPNLTLGSIFLWVQVLLGSPDNHPKYPFFVDTTPRLLINRTLSPPCDFRYSLAHESDQITTGH